MADQPIATDQESGAAASPAAVSPEPAPSPGVVVAAAPVTSTTEGAPAADVAAAPEAPKAEESLLEQFDKEKAAEATKPAEPAAETKPGDPEAPAGDKKPEPAKAEEGKEPAKDAAAPAPLAPIDYDAAIKLPETLRLDDALKGDLHKALDEFRADPAKGAQGLIDLHARTMEQYAKDVNANQWRTFNETRKSWQNEVRADKQIGGSGHMTAMGAIARMRDMFVAEADRPKFEEFLRITGAGDHPQFLKMLHNAARFYDEPPLPPPNPKPTPNAGQPPGKRGMASLYKQGS